LADGRRAQHTRRRAAVATVMTIISGGQTGVDRAALDVALERGLPCGGWCPRGRKAEDGPLPSRYPLRETPTADYAQRTRWNVRDADATLVLHFGRVDRGTALTCRLARQLGKPLLSVDLGRGQPAAVAAWLGAHAVRVLNAAGPRESRCPGVHSAARAFLSRLLAQA
jgi:hypothetical protein